MRPKPISFFSRAAMLLMMLLTTASAWATDVTVTYKIEVSGVLKPVATITNAETGATVCHWDNGIGTLWPANATHQLSDYGISLTPNRDLDKTGKNEDGNNASTTAFKTEQTTRFSVSVPNNSQYYLKSVTFKEDDTEKASLEVAPNNKSGYVTVNGQKFFNYITVELTTDKYYRLTPSGALSISTTPARTFDNAKYYVAGTDITIEPTNASCIVESVSGVNNATIAADKRSFSFAMPAGNISPSASLTEVYQVSPASGITLSPAAYFTYDGAKYYKPNTTITLSSNVPTGQHVTYKASYNNGNKTLTGNTYTVNSTDRDVTLTALLENNTYYVAFNGNGSTAGSMSNQAFTYGTSQNLAANAFTRTGYTFVGWAMSENGDVVYSNQQSVSNLITTDGGTLTLYAQWTATTYTVHFDAGDDQYAKTGETVTISTNGVTVPEGYTLSGITVTPTVDVTDNGNGTYSFTMPAEDVTVNVVFAPIYDWATVNQGTEDDPYMIYNKAQLLLLAYRVNGTHGQTANDYRGTWFKLGADIEFAYDPNEDIDDYEENYEAIGGYHNGNLCNFKGHFDGQNHTVSGIRLRKDGTDANNMYQGLFGRMVSGAEIQRVHVTDARIKGRWYVSGIIGYLDGGTVRNCTVTESTFTANSDYGTICGSDAGGALRYNYYRHCTVNGTAVLSGMGCRGKDVTTTDGAMPMYVAYIDADGKEQRCIDYTELTGGAATTLAAGWYVAQGTDPINYTGKITLGGDATLILADGCTLNIGTEQERISSGNCINGIMGGSGYYGLTIYGQSGQSGSLNAYNSETGQSPFFLNDYNQHGGNVTLDGIEAIALSLFTGNLTLTRGTLTAKNTDNKRAAIALNTANVSGGTLNATTSGTNTISGALALSGTATVTLSGNVSGNVTIADGQAFTDGTDIYTGTLSSDDKTAIVGQTLTRLTTVSLADATSNATAIGKLNGVTGLDITLSGRTLWKDGAWNTLCLPFDLTIAGSTLDGADVRTLDNANLTDGTLTLNFTNEGTVTTIEAGKPYIIKWTKAEGYVDDDAHNLVSPVFTGVTVKSGLTDFKSEDHKVLFKGTYSPMSWTEEDKSILFIGTENTLYWPQPSGDNIPSLNACRAYFQLTGGAMARQFVLNFGDNETSGIVDAEANSSFFTLHSSLSEWYSMDGVRLNGKPTKKGLYIHNGRKVVIK